MFNIGDYLKKFAIIGADSALLDSAIKKAIAEKTGVKEETLSVSIKGSVAYLSTDRSTKNLIFLSKADIIDSIAKHGLRKKITDIR
jgi:hypothetical protein